MWTPSKLEPGAENQENLSSTCQGRPDLRCLQNIPHRCRERALPAPGMARGKVHRATANLTSRIHCSVILCQHISEFSQSRPSAHVLMLLGPMGHVRHTSSNARWNNAFAVGSATELLWQHGIIGLRRTLDHSHPHHMTDANTSNSSLLSSFHLIRPKLGQRMSGRQTQHFL